MILILMGGPGAGKGSAAEILKQQYNLLHISTGDMFRENIKNNTELGKEAKTYIDKGNLVPDFVTVKLVRERLSRDDVKKQGFLLDGFPRNVYQAEQLDKIFEEFGLKLTKVINIVADDNVIVNRTIGRRVCPKCGATYHIERKKPKVEGKCDFDQEALIHRADDTKDIILERLAVYHSSAQPLEEYYEKKGNIVNISGNGTIQDSLKEINEVLGENK